LDKDHVGPHWLKKPGVAKIIEEAIHSHDGISYDLVAYCIMLNHVHMIFELLATNSTASTSKQNKKSTYAVTRILRLIKGSTARYCNEFLSRSGSFWQHESYDHVIRSEDELVRTIWYVLENPVKAGLVEDWKLWPWTFCKPEFLENPFSCLP